MVDHDGHRYGATVMASLDALHAQQREMVRAMSLGVAMALVAAAAGGWLIGRQTLKPLTRMAEQASRINERDPKERLVAPPAGDELGQLAVSFNGLLDRLASALHHQRQFMADASHELRTPVSVVRTAAQVTLAQRRSVEPRSIASRWSSSASRRTASRAWSTRCSCCRGPRLTACRFAASF